MQKYPHEMVIGTDGGRDTLVKPSKTAYNRSLGKLQLYITKHIQQKDITNNELKAQKGQTTVTKHKKVNNRKNTMSIVAIYKNKNAPICMQFKGINNLVNLCKYCIVGRGSGVKGVVSSLLWCNIELEKGAPLCR